MGHDELADLEQPVNLSNCFSFPVQAGNKQGLGLLQPALREVLGEVPTWE